MAYTNPFSRASTFDGLKPTVVKVGSVRRPKYVDGSKMYLENGEINPAFAPIFCNFLRNRVTVDINVENFNPDDNIKGLMDEFINDVIKFCEANLSSCWSHSMDFHFINHRGKAVLASDLNELGYIPSKLVIEASIMFDDRADLDKFLKDFMVLYKLSN